MKANKHESILLLLLLNISVVTQSAGAKSNDLNIIREGEKILGSIVNNTGESPDTITSHFEDATPSLYTSTTGFVAGHNNYGDNAIMQKITTSSGGIITDLLFWFGAKKGNSNSTIKATIWNDASGKPGSVLATVAVPFSSINTAPGGTFQIPNAAYNTKATFADPVAIPAGNVFWVGFSITYMAGDTVGLITSRDPVPGDAPGMTGDFPNANTETFERHADNSLVSFNDGGATGTSWLLDVALAVFPIVKLNNPVFVPIADFSFITDKLKVDCTDNSSNNPTSWVWIFGDGKSSTQQSPSHTYATSGTYTVRLIASNSAGSDTVDKQVSVTSSVGFLVQQEAMTLLVYPNPTNGLIGVTIDKESDKDYIIAISDMLGKVVASKTIIHFEPNKTTWIDISKHPNGTYFVKIQSDNQVSAHKIMLNK